MSCWRVFGVTSASDYQRVAENSPPGHRLADGCADTYDVDHSDGFILLDQKLRERFFAGGMVKIADVPGRGAFSA